MFGMLGGLLGGGMARSMVERPTPLSGLLSQRKARQGNSSFVGTEEQNPQPQPQQEQSQPPPPPEASPEPSQPTRLQPAAPEPQPFVSKAASQLRQQQPQKPGPVTGGLLDEPAVATQAKPPMAESPVPPAPTVVNNGPGPSPTAVSQSEAFPQAPAVQPFDKSNALGELPPRRVFEQQDGWPSKPVSFMQSKHTSDLGFHMQGNGGPSSYAPQFSYKRR